MPIYFLSKIVAVFKSNYDLQIDFQKFNFVKKVLLNFSDLTSVENLDHLNLMLIIFSAGMAIFFPYQTFVVAYLFIGPIHYLTETQWLSQKKFFLPNKWWGFVLPVFAVLILLFNKLEDSGIFNLEWTSFFDLWSNSFIYLALIGSIVFIFIPKVKYQIGVLILAILLLFLFTKLSLYHIFIGILLPTIIHVYLFTLFFMVYGWKKKKTTTGLINIVLLLLSPLLIFHPFSDLAISSDFFSSLYVETGFTGLNTRLADWLNLSGPDGIGLASSVGLRIQSFLAFIYLYHYLNWFSKTSLIKWHKSLKKNTTIGMAMIWLLIVVLYFINFKLGLLIAVLFSYTHVFLEFPLNIRTVSTLFKRE